LRRPGRARSVPSPKGLVARREHTSGSVRQQALPVVWGAASRPPTRSERSAQGAAPQATRYPQDPALELNASETHSRLRQEQRQHAGSASSSSASSIVDSETYSDQNLWHAHSPQSQPGLGGVLCGPGRHRDTLRKHTSADLEPVSWRLIVISILLLLPFSSPACRTRSSHIISVDTSTQAHSGRGNTTVRDAGVPCRQSV
jgi:hypothetical protein